MALWPKTLNFGDFGASVLIQKDLVVNGAINNPSDIKLKEKSYDNITEIEKNKKDIEIPDNNSKNKYKIF